MKSLIKRKYTLNPPERHVLVMCLRRDTGWGVKRIKEYLERQGIFLTKGVIGGWIYYHKKPFVTNIIKQISKDSKELTPEKAYILGTLCGDGWISTEYRIGLSVCDKEFADYFQYCLEKVYGVKCTSSTRLRKHTGFATNPKKQYVISLVSKLVVEDLQRYLDSFRSKKWRVPIQIKKSSKEIQAAYIKGFADSEGYVRYRKGHSEISLCSSNLKGIKDIQDVLLNTFGIHAKLGKFSLRVPTITLTNYKSLKNYYDQIGFVIKRKQYALISALNSYKRKGLRRYTKDFKQKAMEMLQNGLKHREIARLLNTSHSNIYDWEKQISNTTSNKNE